MQEIQLLNKTFELLGDQGVQQAYDYIIGNKDKVSTCSSQVYNYLYCLAALCGKKDEALSWLEEAINLKEYWYRPEVFEDSDLDSLRDDARFDACKAVSDKRYLEAEKHAKTVCTWNAVTKNHLVLALHGNQQNIQICRDNWDFLNRYSYQVEYLQSRELDSYQLYRWEDDGDGDAQLEQAVESIKWDQYKSQTLCGFSAGCNVILTALANGKLRCKNVILQSPWIPVIEQRLEEVLQALKAKEIGVLVICGDQDEDCQPLTETFVNKAKEHNVNIQDVWIEGLSHEFPEDFEEIVKQYLEISD